MIFVKVGGASIVKVNNLDLEFKKKEKMVLLVAFLCVDNVIWTGR
jgi:hypothetical protein